MMNLRVAFRVVRLFELPVKLHSLLVNLFDLLFLAHLLKLQRFVIILNL